MYHHRNVIYLPTNASPQDRNLALCFSRDSEFLADTMAVLHDTYLNFVPVGTSARRSRYIPLFKSEERKSVNITGVKWVQIDGQSFFVVLSNRGLQIYNYDINNVIYSHACKETGDDNGYAIGICVLKKSILCIGSSTGTVFMFKPNDTLTSFKLINRLYAHDESVTLLEGASNFLLSSSNDMTYLWNYNDKDLDIQRSFSVPGMYDTSPNVLVFKLGLIIIGYKSGEFCIFDVHDEEFCIRTLAHKLKITALDFSANFHIVTVSIDTFIKIWKYEQVKNLVVHEQTIENEEGPLYGVGFLNYNSTEFCTITGDSSKVNLYIDWETELDDVNVE